MENLVVWTQDMSVGVAVLDEDHRRVLGMINDLHKAITEGEGADVLGDILNGLQVYVRLHFETEESYLQQTNYPGLADQHANHQAMDTKTRNKIAQFRKDDESVRPMDVLLFLRDWWVNHIMHSDKKYAEHLAASGIR